MKYKTFYTITLVNNNIDVSTFTRFSETEWSGWSNNYSSKTVKFKNMRNNDFIIVTNYDGDLTVNTSYNIRMIDNYYVIEAIGEHTTHIS